MNFPQPLQAELPENYGFLLAKSSMMKNLGYEKYATGDYFKFPRSECRTKDFGSVVNQIVFDLIEFSDESPIEISNTITMHHFLYTMHFKITLIHDFGEGFVKTDAMHLIEDDVD